MEEVGDEWREMEGLFPAPGVGGGEWGVGGPGVCHRDSAGMKMDG